MNRSTQKLSGKRKRTRFYEIYLTKLLKQVSGENGITSNSKQQLNSILCVITRLVSTKVNELTEMAKKKTLSDKEVIYALQVLFPGDLGKGMVTMCRQAVEKYTADSDTKGVTRQDRAGIIFPPSVTEKYLRNFGYSKTMVSNNAPVALAAAIEYLAGEILENASVVAKQKKRVRITIRDLEIGVRTDRELSTFFVENKLSFLGGGVMPYIHPSLLVKKTKRRRGRKSAGKRTHRYRPGTVSIREIRRFQKTSNCLTLARSPFEKYTRLVVQKLVGDKDSNMKISKNVFSTLQYFIEQQMVTTINKSYMAAIHAGRVKLTAPDLKFVKGLVGLKINDEEPVKSLVIDNDDSSKEEVEEEVEEDVEEEEEDVEEEEEDVEEEEEDVEEEEEDVESPDFNEWKDKQIESN